MAAAETDFFTKVGSPGTATTLSAPGHTIGGTSITVISTTNWPTTTGVVFAMDTFTLVNGVEVRDVGSYTEWEGIVASSTSITNMVLRYGTDQNYAAGTTTRVYIPVSSSRENRLVDGMLVEHDQDGTHSNITATSITATTGTFTNFTINGTSGADGWSPLGQSLTNLTALGNRSYTAVVSGIDTTGVTSVGMRVKLPRTVTAPTQCTSLGATKYFSKSSPSGISFTDDFVISAWVKWNGSLGTTQTIMSRYDGTSGWFMYIATDGTVRVAGFSGGSSNYRDVTSYQSVPIGKWIHVAALLDMSANTAAAGTAETLKSWIMFDGVEIPATTSVGGTSPASLTQAGNLQVGAFNGANSTFSGRLAQVALYSTRVTQAVIRASMTQTLTGSETSLISAYSFNGVLTDLSATGNTLTAVNSATATDTQTPFTNDVTGTSVTAGTTNYGIIMKQTFSTNTTYTIQIPEGETLPTGSGTIGTVSYSTQKTPYGFPGQKNKWVVSTVLKSDQQQNSPVSGTWYNLGLIQLSVPVGEWNVGYNGVAFVNSPGNSDMFTTMSTANNSESDSTFTSRIQSTAATPVLISPMGRSGDISVAAQAIYYVNAKTATASISSINWRGQTEAPIIFRAENNYL